ncbi:hypothetical protein [Amantichitinum ursilacus]|nr:hypothetical protein [Amantichitinum ursilacus]
MSAPLAWTWANGARWQRAGDAVGRTASISMGDASKVYSYDNVGNVTDIVDSAHPQFAGSYRYDNMDRLTTTSIAGTGSWSYTYDANGNRTASATTPFVYSTTSNRPNSITASPVVYFGYDAAGNQTSRGGATFVYDNVGRMVKTTEGSTVLGTYTYNAIGQRMQKTVSGVVTRLVYDEAGHILGEYDGTGKMVQETVYLGDWPVATMRLNSAATAVAYYVWPDHLGSPKQVTDLPPTRWGGVGKPTPSDRP